MSDLINTNGILLFEIMGKENIRKLHLRLPVWEMPGPGRSHEQSRRRLMTQVIKGFPRSLLRYERDDRKLAKLEGDWRRLAPSLWMIPGDVDPSKLYDVLSGSDWAIFATGHELIPPPLHYDEFDKLLIWMKYAEVPFVLENHHWRDRWVVSVNPDAEHPPGYRSTETPYLDREYPALAKLLGLWLLGLREQPVSEEEELVSWFASIIADEERGAFIEESGKILGDPAFPWEEIATRTERKLDASYEVRDWLSRVTRVFARAETVEAAGEQLNAAIESVIDSLRPAFTKRLLFARLEGCSLRSADPYTLDARVSIYFYGNLWWDYDVREYVSTIVIPGFYGSRKDKPPLKDQRFISAIYVPLFRDGRQVHEGVVRDAALRELRSFIRWWPVTKFLATTQYPVLGTGWVLIIVAVLLLVMVAQILWLVFH